MCTTTTHSHFVGPMQHIKFQMSLLKNTDITFITFLTICYYTTEGASQGLLKSSSRSVVFNQGSARSYTNFHFILLVKLNAVFRMRQLNYCTGVPRAYELLPQGSAPAKRLETTDLDIRLTTA